MKTVCEHVVEPRHHLALLTHTGLHLPAVSVLLGRAPPPQYDGLRVLAGVGSSQPDLVKLMAYAASMTPTPTNSTPDDTPRYKPATVEEELPHLANLLTVVEEGVELPAIRDLLGYASEAEYSALSAVAGSGTEGPLTMLVHVAGEEKAEMERTASEVREMQRALVEARREANIRQREEERVKRVLAEQQVSLKRAVEAKDTRAVAVAQERNIAEREARQVERAKGWSAEFKEYREVRNKANEARGQRQQRKGEYLNKRRREVIASREREEVEEAEEAARYAIHREMQAAVAKTSRQFVNLLRQHKETQREAQRHLRYLQQRRAALEVRAEAQNKKHMLEEDRASHHREGIEKRVAGEAANLILAEGSARGGVVDAESRAYQQLSVAEFQARAVQLRLQDARMQDAEEAYQEHKVEMNRSLPFGKPRFAAIRGRCKLQAIDQQQQYVAKLEEAAARSSVSRSPTWLDREATRLEQLQRSSYSPNRELCILHLRRRALERIPCS